MAVAAWPWPLTRDLENLIGSSPYWCLPVREIWWRLFLKCDLYSGNSQTDRQTDRQTNTYTQIAQTNATIAIRVLVFGKFFPFLPDWLHGIRTFIVSILLKGWICLHGVRVRLSRLLVGFRTHLKSMHFHSFIVNVLQQHTCLYTSRSAAGRICVVARTHNAFLISDQSFAASASPLIKWTCRSSKALVAKRRYVYVWRRMFFR